MFINVLDFKTGVMKEVHKGQSQTCDYYLETKQEVFHDENFFEIIKQIFNDIQQSYVTVDSINSDDTLEKYNFPYIQLNRNRQVQWNDFKAKNGITYSSEGFFQVMINRFNEKQYVLDIVSSTKILYFDIKTLQFTSIDLLDKVQSQDQGPIKAVLDDDLGIIIIQSQTEVKVYSLESKRRIKIQESEIKNASIFINNNYLQINSSQETNKLFFKNKKIERVIQFQMPQNLEIHESYQNGINTHSYQIIKRQDIDDESEIYTMRGKSFEDMFNEKLLIQPVFPSFQFEYASKKNTCIALDIYKQFDFFQVQSNFLSKEKNKWLFIAGYGTCFGLFENNLIALETIVKQLSLKEKQSIPILICQKMLNGESPLDFSIKARQQKIINLLLSMTIKYQDHIMFNKLIDKNLNELIKQQIDLQEYFESNLPNYQILDSKFPSQHNDEEELVVGITLNNPKEVHQKYDELFLGKLTELKSDAESMASIEYHLINLPITLQKNPTELMKVLSETDKPEYFENKIIQSIIHYKWNQYTKQFYQDRFYIYLIFMASFIFDIFYQTYSMKNLNDITKQNSGDLENEVLQPNIWVKITTKTICGMVIMYFLIYELKQLNIQRGAYFQDGWNYFDFTHIAAFTIFSILDFITENQDNLILIKILVIILSFMKLFFFLRIYDGFSFLVQMMAGVFKDLKYFLSFFLIMILQFGMIFLVLFKAEQIDEYNGVNKLAYFLMAFRISSGDFQLDDFHSQGDVLVIFTWIIWLIAVMTLNIVFMNFIIAVISESYERVMQKLVAESYKVKAHMIVEREQLFTAEDHTNKEYFPNFIVVRRPINSQTNEAGEWQGFIKDLKYTIRTTAAKSKAEIIQNLHSLQSQSHNKIVEVFQQNSKQSSSNENLDKHFSNLMKEQLVSKSDFQQFKEGIDQQVQGLQNDMDIIKSSLALIIQNQKQ
ncbi:UNKNOWN [Stylonychia lemnae]|uniref:Ion transport domain-containing protein n=1 Tax=Stylonychia lemnae TaxID=5949 RepID=A0A078A7D2_STYLE|nr:UNKNOWN [Stylonychia lemnae]|eukprot:CDW76701.1 UNKNOWN [Stylonychia lemnae]